MKTTTAKTARLAFLTILALMLALAASAAPAPTDATASPATGGLNISADTRGGAYTILTGPEIVETSGATIDVGTITLTIPAGFELDTSAAVAVIISNLTDRDKDNINNVSSGGVVLPAIITDSNHVSFIVTLPSKFPSKNSIKFINISVRPVLGTALQHGDITKSGNSSILGIPNGYMLGSLSEKAGAVTTINITPEYTIRDQGDSVIYDAEGFDQFSYSTGPVTGLTLFGIDLAANGSFSANTYTSQNAGVWRVNGTYNGTVNNLNIVTLVVRDITPPVITIIGSNPNTTEALSAYNDEGATAFDDTNKDITGAIVTVSTVNPSILGVYNVTYSVNDSAGNTAEAVRIVNVVDTTAPIITVLGANPVSVHYGDVYTDEGATAEDNYDGNITGSIITNASINTMVLGNQTVTYDVADSSGNTAHAERIVTVIDTEVPIITMNGISPVDVPINTAYVDAGATALDNADGDITANIVPNSNVNTTTLGNYSVTYDVSDISGNAALTVTRIVRVVDITPPVITINGDNPVTLERTSPYTDAGATATDDVDGDLTSAIVVYNPVDPNTVGTYTITYDVSDGSGNSAHAERTVYVEDTTPPELMSAETQDADNDGMIDSIVLTFNENIGDEFLHEGTPDNWDVDGYDNEQIGTGSNADDTVLVLTFDESNSSDTGATPGITYIQSQPPEITSTHDLAENELENISTTASDGAKPILTINGANPMTITTGDTFTDLGANATEEGTITTTGTVNSSVAGTYYITYSMTDNAGNEAANVTRTVNVVNPIVTTGGGGGGGSGGPRTTPPPAPTAPGQPFTFPSLPLVTGGNNEPQAPAPVETGNPQPETAPAETGDLPIIQPQATGIFNLNTRMKWFGIGALLLLLLALGAYAFNRMRKNNPLV